MYNLPTVIDRINAECEKNGISVNQMLIASTAGKSLVDNMKRGRNPSIDKLYLVASYLNTTSDYLLGLTDEPTQNEPEVSSKNLHGNESVADLMNNIENNAKVMNIKGLQRLSDYSDDLIINPAYISKLTEPDNLIEFVDAADAARLSSKHNLIIPFFENAVSAGIGEEFITDAEHFIRIPQTYKKLHADYAVRISGNSMEPDYKNDDILLVRYQQQLEPGELGIFIVGNKMYFKKLGTGRLISLNAEYDDLIINADFTPVVQGKVISKIENNA